MREESALKNQRENLQGEDEGKRDGHLNFEGRKEGWVPGEVCRGPKARGL